MKVQTGVASAFSGIPDNRVRSNMRRVRPTLVRHVRSRYDNTNPPVGQYELVRLDAGTCCDMWWDVGTFLTVNKT